MNLQLIGRLVSEALHDGCSLEELCVVATRFPETWPRFQQFPLCRPAGALSLLLTNDAPGGREWQKRQPGCVTMLLEEVLDRVDVVHLPVDALVRLSPGGEA